MPRRVVKAGLNGPTAATIPVVPLDLGLSPAKAADLHREITTLLFRWKPFADDPNDLGRDVYRLLQWVLDEEYPTCKLLREYPVEKL